MRQKAISIMVAGALALSLPGCGASTDRAATTEAGKPVAPPPRPGEDAMKAQMEKLQQKVPLSKMPGVPSKK